jgi:hypothetical protein
MKISTLNLILSILILLAGCQSKDTLTFIGHSENWSAEVILHQASGKESEDIILKYNGDSVDSVGKFKFLLDAPGWGTGQDEVQLNKEGIYSTEGKSLNDKKTPKDAELTITIEWDNKSETIQLTNKK